MAKSSRKYKNSGMVINKIPPQVPDVERTVLGSMLIDSNALDTSMEVAKEDYFYVTAHMHIFNAIKSLCMKDISVDLITLTEELRKKELLETVGAEAYLSELVENVATSANIGYHVKILEEKAMLRGLISAAANITTECFDPDAEAKLVADRAESKIFSIADKNIKSTPEPIRKLLSKTFADIQRYAQEGGSAGVQTGFTKLDEMTTGFHPSDLIILAARPGMGKTSLAISMMMNASVRAEKKVPSVLFSLEMSKDQLVQRMLCSEARIDIHRLRGGRLTKKEMKSLAMHANPLHTAPLFIDDSPGINIMELRAKCRRLKAKEDIGLIVIDYLQLMNGLDKSESRQVEISQISRSLKEIAKELEVPIIALSQLSRAVEQRTTGNHRPQLSDLRESGAIEQDADCVLFVFREYKYKPEDESLRGIAEIIIGKQRNGPVGTTKVAFIEEFAAFENLDLIHLEEESGF